VHSRAENLEVVLHHRLLGGRVGQVRLLAYLNHANMGVYQEAINAALAGEVATPDITSVRAPGRLKWGFGLNVEQPLTDTLDVFGRAGWNNGKTESFAFTEVDDTLELGLSVDGAAWRRALDRAGVAFVTNGLSAEHRQYLALGGLGFILGDGALDYSRESIGEAYYNAHLWYGLYAALDAQFILHPGYNQARGPVFVGSLRVHFEL
jgi:carbohydrate-selective porin OprB